MKVLPNIKAPYTSIPTFICHVSRSFLRVLEDCLDIYALFLIANVTVRFSYFFTLLSNLIHVQRATPILRRANVFRVWDSGSGHLKILHS